MLSWILDAIFLCAWGSKMRALINLQFETAVQVPYLQIKEGKITSLLPWVNQNITIYISSMLPPPRESVQWYTFIHWIVLSFCFGRAAFTNFWGITAFLMSPFYKFVGINPFIINLWGIRWWFINSLIYSRNQIKKVRSKKMMDYIITETKHSINESCLASLFPYL